MNTDARLPRPYRAPSLYWGGAVCVTGASGMVTSPTSGARNSSTNVYFNLEWWMDDQNSSSEHMYRVPAVTGLERDAGRKPGTLEEKWP